MADNRGGARVPSNPASYSGVGRNSRRTDGQRVASPNVQEGTDLSIGDRRTIEAGQRAQPLSKTPTPRIQAPPPQPGGKAGIPQELPDYLLKLDSTRPGEDEMTPAQGPVTEPTDDMEVVLQFLIDAFSDGNAKAMLDEHRASKQQQAQAPQQPMPWERSQTPMQPEIEAIGVGGDETPVELTIGGPDTAPVDADAEAPTVEPVVGG